MEIRFHKYLLRSAFTRSSRANPSCCSREPGRGRSRPDISSMPKGIPSLPSLSTSTSSKSGEARCPWWKGFRILRHSIRSLSWARWCTSQAPGCSLPASEFCHGWTSRANGRHSQFHRCRIGNLDCLRTAREWRCTRKEAVKRKSGSMTLTANLRFKGSPAPLLPTFCRTTSLKIAI